MHHTGVAAKAASAGTAVTLRRSALLASCLALFAVSYYFAARLGPGFRFQHSQIGIIWPANALLLSALVLTARRRWWLVLVAAALAHTAALGHVAIGIIESSMEKRVISARSPSRPVLMKSMWDGSSNARTLRQTLSQLF